MADPRPDEDDLRPSPAEPGTSADESEEPPTVSAAPIDVPTTRKPDIAGYTLYEVLGHGATSVVYRAEKHGQPCAVKVLKTPLIEASVVERFRREAQTLSQLEHPHLVKVFDHGVSDRHYYIALELLQGSSIFEALQTIELEGGDATQFGGRLRWALGRCEEVASALAYLHSKNIVHRDIKPQNILIDTEGRARLVDLGLAHDDDQQSLTLEGELIGTVAYMSPEQAMAGRVDVDHTTDIYSLGVTLYTCVTGTRPFQSERNQDTLRAVLLHDPPPLRKVDPALPRDLERVVSTCMEKDSRYRYQNAQNLADDLRRVRNLQPVSIRGPSLVRRVRRWVNRHRAALAVLLIAVIATAIVGWNLRQSYLAQFESWVEVEVITLGDIDPTTVSARFPREQRVMGWDDAPERLPKTPGGFLAPPGNQIEARYASAGKRYQIPVVITPYDGPTPCILAPDDDPHAEWIEIPGNPGFAVRKQPATVGDLHRAWERLGPALGGRVFASRSQVFMGFGVGAEMDRPKPTHDTRVDRLSGLEALSLAAALGYRVISEREWLSLLEALNTGRLDADDARHLQSIVAENPQDLTRTLHVGKRRASDTFGVTDRAEANYPPEGIRVSSFLAGKKNDSTGLLRSGWQDRALTQETSGTLTILFVRRDPID
ncbi:MAG: serine/threonine-protein kinase [Planctomycetota bacterium]